MAGVYWRCRFSSPTAAGPHPRDAVQRGCRWLVGAGAGFVLLMLSGTVYHFVFLKAAREGWPVVSQIVRLVVRDEIAQRDRFMRENLDAMAQKVGEMQAKLVRLEAMSDRVSGLAGLKPDELKPLRPGRRRRQGRALRPAGRPSLESCSAPSPAGTTSHRLAHRPVHLQRVAPVPGPARSPARAQRAAGRGPVGLGLRLSHRPHHRPRRLAHRAGLPGRAGHAHRGLGRRRGADGRLARRVRPHGRDSTTATAW
jgi:hypothetical protein